MKSIIILSLVLAQFCFASDSIKKTGTFSNIYYHKEAGDLLGFEIRIVFTRNGYEGIFQVAEGEPDSLIIIKPIKIENDRINFSIPSPSLYEGIYNGILTKNKLIGVLTLKNGNKIHLKLKRGKSYWD